MLKLYRGTVVLESLEADFEVETPHGKVEGRSAYVIIETSQKATKLVVLEGKLSFTNDLGSVNGEAGQTVVTEPKKAPPVPKPADPAKDIAPTITADAPPTLIPDGGLELGIGQWVAKGQSGVRVEPDNNSRATPATACASSSKSRIFWTANGTCSACSCA